MVSDRRKALLEIAVPDAVEKVCSGIVAKPVAAGQPDFGAVLIDYLGSLGGEPVVALLAFYVSRGSFGRSAVVFRSAAFLISAGNVAVLAVSLN